MATIEEALSSLPWRNLPFDILVKEIVPKLPAKSLLRLKCVSKFLKTLISNPKFINDHLLQSLSSNTDRQLILIGQAGGIYVIHVDSSPEPSPVSLTFPGDIKVVPSERLWIVGSSNGLVCFKSFPYCLVIFNPSTGIFMKIYEPDLPERDSYTHYGFGFDDMHDDYKIMRITSQICVLENDNVVTYREVQVYSSKLDAWNSFDRTIVKEFVKTKENGALVHGHLLHWKFWYLSEGEFEVGSSNGKYRIGCFDLRHNRWCGDVSLPDYWLENCSKLASLVHLGVLDGCLCLLIEDTYGKGDDVWVMKEYGVKDSWVKLVYIGFQDGHKHFELRSFAYDKESRAESLVWIEARAKFLGCNTRDNIWCWVEIDGVPPYSKAFISNGSLVSIPGSVRRLQIGATSK